MLLSQKNSDIAKITVKRVASINILVNLNSRLMLFKIILSSFLVATQTAYAIIFALLKSESMHRSVQYILGLMLSLRTRNSLPQDAHFTTTNPVLPFLDIFNPGK